MRKKLLHRRLLLPYTLLFFIFQSLFFYRALQASYGRVQILLIHFLMAAIFSLLIFKIRIIRKRFPYIVILFTLTLGPIGAMMALLTYVLFLAYNKTAANVDDLLRDLNPDLTKEESQIVFERILYKLDQFNPETTMIPFQDVMRYGTVGQKRLVIEKVLRHFEPEFTPILKIGMKDSSNSIRTLAASAITTIDRNFYMAYQKLSSAHHRQRKNVQAAIAFSELLEEYIALGILDDDRERRMHAKLTETYKHILHLCPNDEKIHLLIAEQLYQRGLYEEALKKIKPLIPEDLACRQLLYHLYASILFKLKDYDTLRHFFMRALLKGDHNTIIYRKLQDTRDAWIQEKAG